QEYAQQYGCRGRYRKDPDTVPFASCRTVEPLQEPQFVPFGGFFGVPVEGGKYVLHLIFLVHATSNLLRKLSLARLIRVRQLPAVMLRISEISSWSYPSMNSRL